jgi:hypothetical protein
MDAKTIVRLDALFEAALGLVLVAAAAAGGLDGGDFPHPVGTPIVVAAGSLLLVLAAVLWRGALSPAVLAGANLATAAAAVAWLLPASGFSSAGAWIVVVTVVALVALAVAELAASKV